MASEAILWVCEDICLNVDNTRRKLYVADGSVCSTKHIEITLETAVTKDHNEKSADKSQLFSCHCSLFSCWLNRLNSSTGKSTLKSRTNRNSCQIVAVNDSNSRWRSLKDYRIISTWKLQAGIVKCALIMYRPDQESECSPPWRT